MYGSQNEISAYSDENDNKSVALSESESGVVVTLIQMIIKMIYKAQHSLFSGRL